MSVSPGLLLAAACAALAAACGTQVVDHTGSCGPSYAGFNAWCDLRSTCTGRLYDLGCDGTTCQCTAAPLHDELVAGSPSWTDYTVTVTAFAADGNARSMLPFGIAGRRRDAHNAYVLTLSNDNDWHLERVVDDVPTTLVWGNVNYTATTMHSFALTFSGSSISFDLDGSFMCSVADVQFASGNVSLWTESTTSYASIRVTAPGAADGGTAADGATGVLFSDDFSGDALGQAPAGWTVAGGTWQVINAGASKQVEQTDPGRVVASFPQGSTCSGDTAARTPWVTSCGFP